VTNIGVVGSRKFSDYEFIKTNLLRIIEEKSLKLRDVLIVSGGAIGVDTCGEKFGKELTPNKPLIFKPNYKRYNRWDAPKVRNTRIVQNSNFIIAFYNGFSGGTHDTVTKGYKFNKEVIVIEVEYGTTN